MYTNAPVFTFTTYDDQIKYLTANPDRIHDQWFDAIGIFKMLGYQNKEKPTNGAGCPTMVRALRGTDTTFVFVNGKKDITLTDILANDERIPLSSKDITVDSLSYFKEWQEMIDNLTE